MLAYAIRRLAYGFLVVQGVLGLLFVLFFLYAEPIDMARRAVGEKAPPEVLERWIEEHGYDRPWPEQLRDHYLHMLTFDFGKSDADGVPIVRRLREGAGPSLSFTVPTFVLGPRARHRPGSLRRLLPRDLHRPRWRVPGGARDERLDTALHHRRAVPGREGA